MKLKNIKHVFFDLDHTLWDFDKNSALTFEKIFELHQIKLDSRDFIPVYEPINLRYWKLYREERIKKPELRYGRLKEAFDTLDYPTSDALIHQLSEDYITYLTTFNHLFEGTFQILEWLKPNYKLHIITNGFEEAQSKKMDRSGLLPYFETLTNSEQAGVKKPNPIIFNHALEVAKALPKESVMIGDSFEADILGAENVGMTAIFFNYRKDNSPNEFKTIETLSELKQYL